MADQTYSGVVTAAGTLTIPIGPGTKARTWVVSQVSTELSSAPIGATCMMRKNGAPVTPMVATGDVAGGDPPVTLYGSDLLQLVWTGCTPGTTANVYVIYDEVANR
jgi:hypothetical protein